MAALSKLKPGMILYDYHKVKMGNTNISQGGMVINKNGGQKK